MEIAIYGRSFNKAFNGSIIQIFEILKKHQVRFRVYKPFAEFIYDKLNYYLKDTDVFDNSMENCRNVDMIFSVGGDGTFLETVTTMVKDKGIPVLGINSGRLGFLANVSKEMIPKAIESVIKGDYKLDKRSLLSVQTEKNDFGENNFALNEICLQKYVSSSMIKVNAYYDNMLINTYWSDGLIVSTPTGSSAYSLSCGGPIVHPNSENFVITPIAPHNLTVRPIVLSDKGEIKLKIEKEDNPSRLSLDYRSVHRVFDEQIKITKAGFKINLVKLFNNNYFSTLQKKLMWGVDLRNY